MYMHILRRKCFRLSTTRFEKALTDFVDTAKHLRQEYIFEMSHLAMQNALANSDYREDTHA